MLKYDPIEDTPAFQAIKNELEEKILAMQERKREIFDQVVDNPVLSAEKFTIEDLKFLLG